MMAPHPKISHLTENQINDLIDRYYKGESTKVLIDEYNLDVTPSTFVKILPNLINRDIFCPYCENINMETKRVSRNSFKSYEGENTYCPECGHYANKNYCACPNCKEIKKSEARSTEEKKRNLMIHNERFCQLCAYDLSFKEVLTLLSLIRHSLSDDLQFFYPFKSSPTLLTPYYNFTDELITSLYRKEIICISSTSDVASCVFNEDLSKITGYYPTLVTWKFLPGLDSEDKKSFIKDLERMAKDAEQILLWEDEITEAWRLINKYEAIQHFILLLDQRGFKPKEIGEKTHTVFDELLNHHSIAQIFNLSWQAARDTADWAIANKIPKPHATNAFIGSVQRKSERARAEKWQVRYSRRECPQSTISSTLFDGILEIGQKILEVIPPKSKVESQK